MRVVIVTGGYINDTFAIEWLKKNKYDYQIAADSGMEFFYRTGLEPNVIAGDFDSVKEEILSFFSQNPNIKVIRLNPIKDDTDTEFAIRFAISEGAEHITILGATGTRFDHVIGNIHLLGIGLEEGVTIELVDKYNRIRMVDSPFSMKKSEQFGKYVSFLPFAGNVKGVTLKGFRYPLTNATMESFCSLGVSNEIVEEVVSMEIEEGILLMIEARD
ncbi:MAG: thiamine diphosphokinase [Lachnospiraceae bacterium]|nr:thiamine diphosphokinase [Lachnospiraceae bacterium]